MINSENETHKKLPTNIDMELVVKNTIIYISSLRKLNDKREKIYKNMIYDIEYTKIISGSYKL